MWSEAAYNTVIEETKRSTWVPLTEYFQNGPMSAKELNKKLPVEKRIKLNDSSTVTVVGGFEVEF